MSRVQEITQAMLAAASEWDELAAQAAAWGLEAELGRRFRQPTHEAWEVFLAAGPPEEHVTTAKNLFRAIIDALEASADWHRRQLERIEKAVDGAED